MEKIRAWKKWIGAWVFAALLTVAAVTGCAAGPAETAAAAAVQTQSAETQTRDTAVQTQAAEMQTRDTAVQTQAAETQETDAKEPQTEASAAIDEHGSYTTKDEVALYLHTYGRLPDNYITKKEAQKLGWDSKKGNLDEVAPGKSIGGSHFGNYEGQLPEKDGRKYFECDLGYEGGYRGAERIIYSDDGLVFYTGDHYKTFEQLY